MELKTVAQLCCVAGRAGDAPQNMTAVFGEPVVGTVLNGAFRGSNSDISGSERGVGNSAAADVSPSTNGNSNAAVEGDVANMFPGQEGDSDLGWSSTFMDVVNMLKAFIGLNFMYVAFAFSKAGLVRGVLGLILLIFITEHCCLLLVEVKNTMPPPEPSTDPHHVPKPPTFADIARYVGGAPMESAVNFALMITQFGYCVGYLIFISQTVHDLVRANVPVWPFIIVPLPILIGLALLRSIRSLGPWSLLANAALLTGFIAVVTYIGQHFRWQPSSPSLLTFPLFFGQMTAALEGIGLVVPVETSMRNPARFPLVLRLALLIMMTVLMVVGVLGFATFGDETRSIILLNFGDSPIVSAVKGVLVIGILFTYPLQLVPIIQAAEGYLIGDVRVSRRAAREQELADVNAALSGPSDSEFDDDDDESFGSEVAALPAPAAAVSSTATGTAVRAAIASVATPGGPATALIAPSRRRKFVHDPRQVMVRIVVVLATGLTATLAGASFGLFQSLVGSIGASSLAYTAPALFHVKIFGDKLTPLQKAKDWVIFAFGVLGSVIGTLTTLWEIGRVHASDTAFSP